MSSTRKTAKTDRVDFEALLRRIAEHVAGLEDQETSLEDNLKHFEDAVRLLRQAQNALSDAEQRVNRLSEEQPVKGGEQLP